jgi:hypothetical protein
VAALKLNDYERIAVAEATRQLLCVFASADWQRPLPWLHADWREVFEAVCSHGLVSLTHAYLQHLPDSSYPPAEFRQWVSDQDRTSQFFTRLMYRRMRETLSALNAMSFEFLLIKGPVLAHQVYPDPLLRPFNDIDLIVREHDWATMHQQLLSLGFELVAGFPEPPPKVIPQDMKYESQYRHPEKKFLVEVHYDDILNAGLAARDVHGFWQRSQMIDIGGLPVRAMSREDQLIHACAHAHYHGYVRLNWLTDIVLLMRNGVDWDQVMEIMRAEEAEVSTYYSLYYSQQMLDAPVPDWVLRATLPDRFRRLWHERLAPADRVMSLAPMWHPDFSFYFQPLLKRLLPTLLVMGRRREQFHYLWRLLTPPPGWLRHYYHLPPDAMLWPHYFLHPAKLLAHYIVEIFQNLSGRC